MSQLHTTEPQLDTVARLRAAGWSASRILSGLGLPGFGQAFARKALANMEAYGLTAHEACFGGLSADRKIYIVRGY